MISSSHTRSSFIFTNLLFFSILLVSPSCAQATESTSSLLQSIHYIFSFGDSYTASAYNPISKRYDFAETKSITAVGGQTWIQEIAKSNDTIALMNYAVPSATISNAFVGHGALDFSQQAAYFFSTFQQNTSWTADNSLFTIWFGIEDLLLSQANNQDFDTLQPKLLTALDDVVSLLHTAGARQFLFLDMPPLDRSPLAQSLSANATATLQSAVKFWNKRLNIYTQLFSTIYTNSKASLYSTGTLIERVINDTVPGSVWTDSTNLTASVHALIASDVLSVLANFTSNTARITAPSVTTLPVGIPSSVATVPANLIPLTPISIQNPASSSSRSFQAQPSVVTLYLPYSSAQIGTSCSSVFTVFTVAFSLYAWV